jgi:hypothetical protein
MKKNILIFVLALSSIILTSAAVIEDGPKEHEIYCQIVGTRQFLSTKLTITVDYGEPRKWFSDQRMKDESGKVQKFNSMIDAMNYMAEEGWTFVCAYPVTHDNSDVYHYTLKKRVVEEE